MQKLSLICICLISLFSQKLTKLNSFSDVQSISEDQFYLAWELPITSNDDHHSFNGSYHFSNEPNFKFDKLVSDRRNRLFILQFDGDKLESTRVGSAKSNNGIYKNLPIYWLGKQDINNSYSFILQLLKSVKKEKHLYGILNHHDKNKETLAFYKKRYSNSDHRDDKEDIVFWTGQLNYSPALDFLKDIYSTEKSYDIKEKIIFAFSLEESSERTSFLIQVAKTDRKRALRKKAIFWLSNMASKHIEHFFNEIIYSDEDIELKESAIFALYQREAKDDLMNIAESGKDVRLRKKAIFWLGQLGGEEHLKFLEDVLNKN